MQQPAEADVVIVNTCSVTAEADRAARAFIRRAHRLNPEARIVVTGCYAQRAPGRTGWQWPAWPPWWATATRRSRREIAIGLMASPSAANQGTTSVAPQCLAQSTSSFSSRSRPGLRAISALDSARTIWADDRFAHSFLEEAQLVPGAQTRPNLKIQEGCGNRCTFCVIPQTRGASQESARRSRP